MNPNTPPQLSRDFDPDLWKGGVEDGAFSGDRDPDSLWYVLKVGSDNVALASAVPGPGDLTTISYFVHPDHREKGYGTKIASQVTDLHERATFTIFKDNEASIKVAVAALREKFSMTMGHNVVRLTKEAGEKKATDPLLLGAFGVAGLMGGALGVKLGQKIRDVIARRRMAKQMAEAPMEMMQLELKIGEEGLREILKQSVSMRHVMRATRAAQLARKGSASTYQAQETAKALKKLPATPMTVTERKSAKGMIRGEQALSRNKELSRAISKRIRQAESPQESLF